MTVRELRDMIQDMDDSYKLTIQTSDGTQREIKDASQEGKHFTFWTDSVS